MKCPSAVSNFRVEAFVREINISQILSMFETREFLIKLSAIFLKKYSQKFPIKTMSPIQSVIK